MKVRFLRNYFQCLLPLHPVLLFLVVVGSGSSSSSSEPLLYFIDPQVVFVDKWEGWGTSLAWWADVLGGMDEPLVDAVTDAFFNPDKLNLNIVRYVIGGTSPEDAIPFPCGPYRPGAASESYRDGPEEPYNWTRDARQRKILEKAISLGANVLEAFSNSPPQWMTISGCAKGNPGDFFLHENFDGRESSAFAEYATDVLLHFKEVLNISFHYYSPFNEPFGLAGVGSWWGRDNSQEGCNMRRETMIPALQALSAALAQKEMDWVAVAAADETQINTAVETAKYFVEYGVSGMIRKWNVHGYWDTPTVQNNRRDRLNIIAWEGGQRLWMDEMGWGSTPLGDMTQAFEVSRRILADVRGMMPSAWLYWQAMTSVDGWGLISAPYRSDAQLSDIHYNSGYYGLLQYSKYIREGGRIVQVNDPTSLASLHETTRELVIVTSNEGEEEALQKTFNLGRLEGAFEIKSATRTSSTEQNVPLPETDVGLILSRDGKGVVSAWLSLPPRSITTLVLSNVAGKLGGKNLLRNGDFEEMLPEGSSWSAPLRGNISSTEFPWRGARHAVLNAALGDNVISQSFTLPPSGRTKRRQRLYLSLMGSAVGSNSKVEARVGGIHVAEVWFHELPGYRAYGLTFTAEVGDKVEILLRCGYNNGPCYLDNVELYQEEEEDDDEEEEGGGGGGGAGAAVLSSTLASAISLTTAYLFLY